MLSKLSVRNYAIIDALEVVFTDHLNIITGETGLAHTRTIINNESLVVGGKKKKEKRVERVRNGRYTCYSTSV